MSRTGVFVPGLPRFLSALRRFGRDLEDVRDLKADMSRAAAERIAAEAPRRSGRLAGSAVPTPFGVEVQAPYAGPIQGGWPARNIEPNPFVTRGVAAVLPDVVELAENHVEQATDLLRGTY